MSENTVLCEITDGIARVTLNRPDAANAINLPLARELMLMAIRCDQDPGVRAVVLGGAGAMFSAGGDLRAMAGFPDVSAGLKEMTVCLHAAIAHFVRMRAPLVVAVNGTAAGAGFSLALVGDYVLAARSASFTMAYTAVGLVPDGSSTHVLPRLVGHRRAMELMLTNRRLTAGEAADWGLINRVVDDGRVADEAMAVARTFASGPTRAFGAVKGLLAQSFTNPLETQMELESRAIAEIAATGDGREGIAAFIAKRKPAFTGA